MAVFYKLAVIATIALTAMVSAAPIDPTHGNAVTNNTTAVANNTTAVANNTTAVTNSTTIPDLPSGEQDEISIAAATSGTFSGRGTWYTGSLGSCGKPFGPNDMIVAMNAPQMGDKALCDKSVKITYGGKTVEARVTDTCPSCSSGALDLNQPVFEKLAPLDKGVIDISWEFV
ncbi:hypothetical protein BG011_006773 [Mortierella polycephala]|uniref:RlpA-like protein double-psi beta-barrel domain-containing protein n=1 Tax=Mortierella polycephala TaxID=41804 RepID=A0A9P6QJ64_9FUNG|nr:hypothetical protein BG011_006773 [Mortierella polycephala]